MDISFKFNPEVLIGSDTLSLAGTITSRHGSRIMIAADHGIDSLYVNRLKDILVDSGLEAIVFDGIEETSSAEMADNIVELALAAHCDAIIGFGGQKTQIISRMAAIMAPTRTTAFELLDGRFYPNKFMPLLSIPTEGMSAFSATEYFIAVDPRTRMIKSIQSPDALYSAVIVDSSLFKFLSEPAPAMAYILEGFFNAIEAYCSSKANFISDALLERAITFYAKLLRSPAGSEINAETFSQANFLTAIGSSSSSPGVGAAFAMAINARAPVARQLCSSVLLPAIAERLAPARPEKMARIASFIGAGKPTSVAEGASFAVEGIRRIMGAHSIAADLKDQNIQLDRITAAIEAARGLDLTANSPWTVSEEEVFKILKQVI